jgi:hypothetical protein
MIAVLSVRWDVAQLFCNDESDCGPIHIPLQRCLAQLLWFVCYVQSVTHSLAGAQKAQFVEIW